MNERGQLPQLARALQPEDAGARSGFGLLIRALELEWLDAEDLAQLLVESGRDNWGGFRFEEFGIEPDWGDAQHTHLRVSLLTEKVTCLRQPFFTALERVLRAWSSGSP